MKRNLSQTERTVRVVIGITLLSLMAWGVKSAWLLLGIVPLATGIAGFCPIYSLLGFSTGPRAAKCAIPKV